MGGRSEMRSCITVFDKGPASENQNLRERLSWVCLETLWLISELSNPAVVLQRRRKI